MAGTTMDGLAQVYAVYYAAAKLTGERYGVRLLRADEGGLAPPFPNVEAMFDNAVDAITAAGLAPGADVAIAIDVASSHFYQEGQYVLGDAPCIIFIYEIDAVGRHRGAGLGGGHDEREQTLNQLLVEMDGFEGNEGVIVIAATNRPDVLDPALLRPGRFDRQVVVPLPDVRGREQILKVHMRKVPVDGNVKPGVIARGTPGFSGADLANLVNEAALIAARANRRTVSMEEFDKAKDKIMMGTERRSLVMSESERKLTAYHESGHAIVGLNVPDHDPVYKVTIIPRGRALGVTMFLPEEDRYSYSKQRLMSSMKSLYGGRLAEEIVFGPAYVTTGASNDIERATDIARNMVTKWGLSEKLGPLTYTEDDGEIFLGRSVTRHKQVSDVTAHAIDEEVRLLIDTCYGEAKRILESSRDKLDVMAAALLKYETIDEQQIKDIMDGRDPRPPADWDEPSEPGKLVQRVPDEKGATPLGGPAGQH
jgi:cell division protease FtsH